MSENESECTSPGKRKLSEDEDKTCVDGTNKRRKSEDAEPSTSVDNVVVKTEKVDEEEASSEAEHSSNKIPVAIKTEPVEESASPAIDSSSSAPEPSTSSNAPPVVAAAKTEPTNDVAAAVVKTEPTTNARSPTPPAADSSVSSSTFRPSCRFGIRCYRRNPAHRSAEAHPGDSDYRRPSFPTPPLGTPVCPFGNSCYRRNPVHFQQYSHPPDFNSAQNIRSRLRQRRAQTQNPNARGAQYSDFESEDDEEDPFHDEAGSDLDYRPGAPEDDDDEEEDDLEFNSERQNCDEFD
ncbi:aprataxin and PNK-like factor isoform X1 [Drosophila innubila]|uniref:aprataxin and PNK-like factor isoform X1 n=2 Tax=Drosophila innubila TaxID=198719 RepID=UPI00148D3BA2|nr:aprataxin and PNK-like factor isoform X1 [Drosophila innubila]